MRALCPYRTAHACMSWHTQCMANIHAAARRSAGERAGVQLPANAWPDPTRPGPALRSHVGSLAVGRYTAALHTRESRRRPDALKLAANWRTLSSEERSRCITL